MEKPCHDCALWGDEIQATRLWDDTPLCDTCWKKRDNYEPPDDDRDGFRGSEAAAHQREQIDQARRLK